jgi:hypothetical protein
VFQRHISIKVGNCFILLASFLNIHWIVQFKRGIKASMPLEIPISYNSRLGMAINDIVEFLGLMLSFYLLYGFL